MEIVPGIYKLDIPIPDNPLGHLNCYLIEGKKGWIMVDTGWYTPDAFEAMERGLAELNLTLTDIATMIVTHVHPDHFGLAGRIKQASPETQLLMHHWESGLIESRYLKFRDLKDRMGDMLRLHGAPPLSELAAASLPALKFVTVALPDRVLYGGETIDSGIYKLQVIWTPGHSPGHICLYEPQNRLFFSGDHVLPSITPNVSYHAQSGDNPLGDYLYSLHKVRGLSVSKVLPAHEGIFDDLKARVDQIVRHHDKRKTEIRRAIEKEPLNAYEISARIKWDISLPWEQFSTLMKRSAITETLAHLECMRWDGLVRKSATDESVLYSLA